MHVSVAAEKIAEFLGIPITNSIITTFIVSALLIVAAILLHAKLRYIPGKVQNVVEALLDTLLTLCENVAGRNGREFFPLIATIFLFILISNWLGLFPGLTGIGIQHIDHGEEILTPIFRAATADLNTTIALALVAVIATHYYAFKHLGPSLHLKKYFDYKNPGKLILGQFELIQEFSKIISFSFRLFGNIFAGEVLIVVIGSLIPVLLPVPFIGLEIFVGFIQALVFAMLTLVFASMAVESH